MRRNASHVDRRRAWSRTCLAWPRTSHEWLLAGSIVLGFLAGLTILLLRGVVLPADYQADSDKIWRIASGRMPEFSDESFTPVANAYRFFGLDDTPTLAALLGYLLASAALIVALHRACRRDAGWGIALYVFGSFALAGLYLGQYSKDVFVLPVILLLLMLPRRIWWELAALAAMLAYAFWFREYWALIAAVYTVCRALTWKQLRVRYLLLSGALCAVAIGGAIYLLLGRAPNHYRTSVQGYLDASTFIHPIEPFAQPLGGLTDVFLQYWLLLAPVLLPFTAGLAYAVIAVGLLFVRGLPLLAARSAMEWPAPTTLDGALLRRALSLIVAFTSVQALFEPDYGSVLRHFAPLLPAALVLMQSARSGTPRQGARGAWSLTGR